MCHLKKKNSVVYRIRQAMYLNVLVYKARKKQDDLYLPHLIISITMITGRSANNAWSVVQCCRVWYIASTYISHKIFKFCASIVWNLE